MTRSEIMALNAQRAAMDLAGQTEWAPAGMMLRVASILRDGEKPAIALPFALNARADCLNEAGRRTCGRIIEMIEGGRS